MAEHSKAKLERPVEEAGEQLAEADSAGVGAGAYSSLADAISETVHLLREVTPAPQDRAYEVRYVLYHELHPTLISLQHRI